MAATLFIHAKNIKNSQCEPFELDIDLETLLVLKVYNLCDFGHVKLKVIEKNDLVEPIFRTNLRLPADSTSADSSTSNFEVNCVRLPALIQDVQGGSKSIVAGVCSVARQLIKCSGDERVQYLLGFRESCLAACSESSIWTKFCEVDMIGTVRKFLKQKHEEPNVSYEKENLGYEKQCLGYEEQSLEYETRNLSYKVQHLGYDETFAINSKLSKNNLQIENQVKINENNEAMMLPDDLLRFEYHLQQPVRMHNVYKVARVTQNDKTLKSTTPISELKIPHCYSEGPEMTLSDIILLPSFIILQRLYSEDVFLEHLPLVYEWLEKMKQFESFSKLIDFELITSKTTNQLSNSYTILINPNVKKESLYSSDPNRYKPTNRIYTKQDEVEKALEVIQTSKIKIKDNVGAYGSEIVFNWEDIPMVLRPEGGALPKKRSKRKEEQLENLLKAVIKVTREKSYLGEVKIVDFCSGSGHLGLLLAFLLPECTVFLVENKEKSLERALVRIQTLGLLNVVAIQSNLDYFHGRFEIGVSLHACGVATDLVMQNCIENKAHFVCCPCCYGGIHDCYHLTFPRSVVFQDGVDVGDYMKIAHAADQTHDKLNKKTEQGYRCMDIIDSDRCLYAEGCGYEVVLGKLYPNSCTPKNNLLVGLYVN